MSKRSDDVSTHHCSECGAHHGYRFVGPVVPGLGRQLETFGPFGTRGEALSAALGRRPAATRQCPECGYVINDRGRCSYGCPRES